MHQIFLPMESLFEWINDVDDDDDDDDDVDDCYTI